MKLYEAFNILKESGYELDTKNSDEKSKLDTALSILDSLGYDIDDIKHKLRKKNYKWLKLSKKERMKLILPHLYNDAWSINSLSNEIWYNDFLQIDEWKECFNKVYNMIIDYLINEYKYSRNEADDVFDTACLHGLLEDIATIKDVNTIFKYWKDYNG